MSDCAGANISVIQQQQELKSLRRQRQRAFRKGPRSENYLRLRTEFSKKLKIEAEKYRVKIINEVTEGRRSNSYKALRKLEFGEHSAPLKGFILPNHSDENLSPQDSAERLADYFSKISQSFEPIDVEKLAPWIQDLLTVGIIDKSKPVLEAWQVYNRMCKSKKPNSIIPGDLPPKLIKEFSVELAEPVSKIFNRITHSGQYPRQWVVEYQTAIPKTASPQSEDDTRNIASTAYLSKLYESFIGDWILPFIEPHLDPAQCGGLKKSSITHCLVKLLHFVHGYLDLKEPHAVLLILVDLEKAFNRVSHQHVIEVLADMKVLG